MINAAIVAASCSALSLAPHIEENAGVKGPELMRIIMDQFAGLGVPGAAGMFATDMNPTVGSATSFAAPGLGTGGAFLS